MMCRARSKPKNGNKKMINKSNSTMLRSFKQAWTNTAVGVLCVSAAAVVPQMSAAQDMSGFYAGAMAGRDVDTGIFSKQDTEFGGFAGYNFDMGTAMIGGELTYNAASDSALDRAMHLKARAGMAVAGGLLYGTAGIARANDVAGGGDARGTVYGVGYDFAISENVILGAEYLRSQYSDVGVGNNDNKSSSLSLRAGFRF
jgi:opacity protein-like surface antigen